MTLKVVDASTGAEYFAQGWPVRRRYEPEIYVRKYRSLNQIAFENNFEFLSEYPLSDIQAELTIVNKASGATVFDKQLTYSTYTPRDEASTKDWAIGNYDVRYRFTAKGKEIGKAETMYEHAALPAWWDSDVGNEDYKYDWVPYPWTSLAVNGTTLDCIGRRYHFGDGLFPQQIETQGKSLLRAPMTVKAVAADGGVLSSDTAKCTRAEWTKKTKVRIEGLRKIGNDALSLRNELWAEYDGFVWCKLTIVPKEAHAELADARHSGPPEFTDVMNAYNYGLADTGKIHAAVKDASPFWLGNGVGGIQWLNECDEQLFVKNTREVVHVIPGKGEGATLRVDLVNVPTDFEKKRTIEFGFVATPTRPKIQRTWKDPDQWGLHGSVGGCWYPEGQEFQAAPDYGMRGGWTPGGSNPCYSGLERIYVTTASAKVDDADGQNFGDEWLADAATRLKGNVSTTQASKRYVNYFVWRHWNAMQNQYPYQSWYFDTPNEAGSGNAYAGAGFVTSDGRRTGERASSARAISAAGCTT